MKINFLINKKKYIWKLNNKCYYSQFLFEILNKEKEDKIPIKAWIKGLPIEEKALQQLHNISKLPFLYKHIAVMPDVHWGIGATVGSVIATTNAIIPSAVGVDIGCGMNAIKTSLKAENLPENLKKIRNSIEKIIPHGRTHNGGDLDKGAFQEIPEKHIEIWKKELEKDFKEICRKHPSIKDSNSVNHLATLGTGNHFIEICLDENNFVWLMLHSGSRGVGNKIGTYFIELAKKDMKNHIKNLPDEDLAYFSEGTKYFNDYCEAVLWAQKFAFLNRKLMMDNIIECLHKMKDIPPFTVGEVAVNCHHNYVSKEYHFGQDVWITRKGAVRASKNYLGIIPGSMGAKSYIVRGLGNKDSFESCSHGAGRLMSRGEAKKRFTIQDHEIATKGIECRKDKDVIDETPAAYKDIDQVIEAQKDLIEVVHILKQIIVIKG